jgi:succinoglycan biosynthesis transport protein ExoP
VELRDYLNVMRSRSRIVILAVVVVTLTVLAVSLLQSPAYQGEARVFIGDTDAGAAILGSKSGDSGGTERSSQTQVELMTSQPVLEKAIRSLKLQTTPKALRKKLTVKAVGQTNVITITATDGNPERAAVTANAVANAYVQWSRETKRESINAAADEVQVRLDAAKAEILDVSRRIQGAGRTEGLAAELTIATAKYSALSQKLEDLRVNEDLAVGSGRVTTSAAADPNPVSPKPVRNGILAIALGLIVGVGLAFLLESMDDTIKSMQQAEELYGAPVLGNIPGTNSAQPQQRTLSIVDDPGGPAAEAYRVLRNNLNFVNFQNNIKTLLITSSVPAEGKSTVAANLAMALVNSGAKVALVNSDLRRPATGEFFDVHNRVGLSDVLLGGIVLEAALQRPVGPNLLVLNSGTMPPNPSELIGSEQMAELLSSLQELSDWVILDSPPLLAASDASALVQWSDAVLMVAHGGVSTRRAAEAGREMLEKVGARTVGVVLWGLKVGPSEGLGFYGSYGHADHTSEPGDNG